MRKLIMCAFVLAFVGTCLVIITDSSAKGPLVITKKIFYPDPLLMHDFTAKTYIVPPVYDPDRKINPFLVILPAEEKATKKQELVKLVPTTPLTKWAVGQLKLTSVVINHVFAYAYFTTPESTRVYRGEVGNYVGKSGGTIASIEYGVVNLTDGTNISINH